MNYVTTALLLAIPFLTFCHRSLPDWWNTPHQSAIGAGPLINFSTNFKIPNLSQIKESHHGIILRENGVRYVLSLHIKPNGGKPEISGLIFPSGKADALNFFIGQLEEGKDRTWVRLMTKPAQEIWGTRKSYTTKLELETRLSLLEDSTGNIYLHPTTDKSAVYTAEPSKIFKAAQGRWLSTDAESKWDLNLNLIEGDYLRGTLTSTSGKGTCKYQAIASTAIAINRYLIFTTEDQSREADCPAYAWEVVLPENNEPLEFQPINSNSPELFFSKP